jgi:hypothetical protein
MTLERSPGNSEGWRGGWIGGAGGSVSIAGSGTGWMARTAEERRAEEAAGGFCIRRPQWPQR